MKNLNPEPLRICRDFDHDDKHEFLGILSLMTKNKENPNIFIITIKIPRNSCCFLSSWSKTLGIPSDSGLSFFKVLSWGLSNYKHGKILESFITSWTSSTSLSYRRRNSKFPLGIQSVWWSSCHQTIVIIMVWWSSYQNYIGFPI